MELQDSRPRANTSPRTPLLDGVYFLAKLNKKRRLFLPSSKNFFGNLQVEKVMVDSGCNTLLLPLKEYQIIELSKIFPDSEYSWSISKGQSISTECLSLIIKHRVKSIPLRLCEDFPFPAGKPVINVSCLRFHLCSDDINLLNTLENIPLLPQSIELLKKFTLKNNGLHVRRHHALIGQEILHQTSYIQHATVLVVVDPSKFNVKWENISRMEQLVDSLSEFFPANFADLEDEDHVFIDENYSLIPEDYIDE